MLWYIVDDNIQPIFLTFGDDNCIVVLDVIKGEGERISTALDDSLDINHLASSNYQPSSLSNSLSSTRLISVFLIA